MREGQLESSDTVYVILKMLISGRITSGVPNKGSTQLIFDASRQRGCYNLLQRMHRQLADSEKMSLTTADGEFLAAVTSALECEITTLQLEALEPSHRVDNASMASYVVEEAISFGEYC